MEIKFNQYKTTGFHTISNKGRNEDHIKNGPYKCSREDAWLTEGYYYWEKNLNQAKHWGKCSHNNSYKVIKSDLILDKMFDLIGDCEHLEIFNSILNKLNERTKYNNISNSVSVQDGIKYIKTYIFKDLDAIRSKHFQKQSLKKFVSNKKEKVDLSNAFQICVFVKDKISNTEILDYDT